MGRCYLGAGGLQQTGTEGRDSTLGVCEKVAQPQCQRCDGTGAAAPNKGLR
jgi:hypothetical protein